ncbi:hypothetical protein D917_05068 [Trichinella nativa]|uniref:Uncharacterized protein n=1 Tax=Trichinella nativa TaxID=6335 RepID=A0A1Y3F198_9BILA|nr:hypothetical protein D917_05068 [Trichinella nativa]
MRLLAAPGWGQRGPMRRPRLTVAPRREEPEQYAREVCTGNIETTYTEEPSREELVRTVVETFVLPLGTNGCSARSRTRRACSRSGSEPEDANRRGLPSKRVEDPARNLRQRRRHSNFTILSLVPVSMTDISSGRRIMYAAQWKNRRVWTTTFLDYCQMWNRLQRNRMCFLPLEVALHKTLSTPHIAL